MRKSYELRIKGEGRVQFEASTMIGLLRQAAMYYHDWWFVHDGSDLGDLMSEYDGEPASEFKSKLGVVSVQSSKVTQYSLAIRTHDSSRSN